MFLQRSSRVFQRQWRVCRSLNRTAECQVRAAMIRGFHSTRNLQVVKPVLLADIGEGIVECEIIQWFVETGARVEEFSPLCEVQSDKASVEITSRFSGVVKKLHYEAGEMAKVGKPFVDIDIQGGASQEALDALTAPEPAKEGVSEPLKRDSFSQPPQSTDRVAESPTQIQSTPQAPPVKKDKSKAIAVPAVRFLSKQLNIDINDVEGTGRDGRVMKEDLYKFIEKRDSPSRSTKPGSLFRSIPTDTDKQIETTVQLTNTQLQMFKTMTRSLTIPHFLYADEVDFSQLYELRKRLNKVVSQLAGEGEISKLTYLPFIIKGVSMALHQYPILNARVDVDTETSRPTVIHRSQHNIGVAMDTPSGLLVPVIKNVGAMSVLSIAAELSRLQSQAAAGKLSPQDLSGGTITVSNIGNIGGTYVSPVIVEKEVAILGIGRIRTVPAFDDKDNVVKKHVCNFSWCADHRIVDGATMARAAEVVRKIVEEPDVMTLHLR
ncbi:2-oxoacid dehydrogenases acyltransferase-domain-containing protein [Annulohypoxylon maeteangense]|uniref:2-oxoacid dehydrogenases acyltransferase-domain-containing protein n=1 Tax=Annulohypoxylon maeteangense TaxID=1927788 RepID=UPI00200847C9|nr:2-oxoacid dehydrogenases acyltransferase-domain-containing protein [Annulohypoxylon maeteangense]KAI0889969.1 2-oxoacid dehydrogenases acyltransferase-domain-containing protein [Annulohypoxylon maeteangense]